MRPLPYREYLELHHDPAILVSISFFSLASCIIDNLADRAPPPHSRRQRRSF